MIRCSLLAILGTALVGTGVETAQAQKKFQIQPRAVIQRLQILPGGAGRYGQPAMFLLRNPKVQEELKLDGDQKTEIKEAFDGYYKSQRDEYAKLRGLQLAERRKKNKELQKNLQAKRKELDKSLRGLLKKEQRTRLDQIVLQRYGLNGLSRPEVAKKLKISSEQQNKIKDVQKSATEKQRKLRTAIRNGTLDRTKYREKLQEIQKEREKKTLEVLTKEQRAEFEKMKGKRFDFGRRFGRPGLRAVPLPAGKIRIKRIRVRGKVRPQKPAKPKVEKPKEDKTDK